MQSPRHSRKSIQVYYAIDCRLPLPDLSAWILIHVSFTNPNIFTAESYVRRQDEDGAYGQRIIETEALTPYEAVKALLTASPLFQVEQSEIDAVVLAVKQNQIFTPTIPLNEAAYPYMPLPAPAIVLRDVPAILTHDSVVPVDVIDKLSDVMPLFDGIKPIYESNGDLRYRVGDLLQ